MQSLENKFTQFRKVIEEWFSEEQSAELIDAERAFFKDVSEIVSSCIGTKSENIKDFEKG